MCGVNVGSDAGWKSRDNLVSRAVSAKRGRASKSKRVLRRGEPFKV